MLPVAKLRSMALENGVTPATIFKDYLMTWLLAGLSESPLFKMMWFAGGTALKKVYYRNFRFSEDVDLFTPGPCVSDRMTRAMAEVTDWVYEELGVRLSLEGPRRTHHRHRYEYRLTDDYFYGRGMIPDRHPLMLDIACFDPEYLEQPREKALMIEYDDVNKARTSVKLLVPSIIDILIQKMFAVQDRKEPRDLYDIGAIFENENLPFDRVIETYSQRFHPISREGFLREIKSPMLEKTWDIRLSHQVAELPPFNKVIESLSALIRKT